MAYSDVYGKRILNEFLYGGRPEVFRKGVR